MMSKFSVGDEVTVTINGTRFLTVITNEGQYFKRNSVAIELFNLENPLPTFFELSSDDRHSLDGIVRFYDTFGYSLDLLKSKDFLDVLEVRNPVWEENDWMEIRNTTFAELMKIAGLPYEHSGNASTRYVHDAIMAGKWAVKMVNYVAASDTITRVLRKFFIEQGIQISELEVPEDASDEVKAFLKTL